VSLLLSMSACLIAGSRMWVGVGVGCTCCCLLTPSAAGCAASEDLRNSKNIFEHISRLFAMQQKLETISR
jgi:hypothetical protein